MLTTVEAIRLANITGPQFRYLYKKFHQEFPPPFVVGSGHVWPYALPELLKELASRPKWIRAKKAEAQQ